MENEELLTKIRNILDTRIEEFLKAISLDDHYILELTYINPYIKPLANKTKGLIYDDLVDLLKEENKENKNGK